jgi:cell shape-determining protein MreC
MAFRNKQHLKNFLAYLKTTDQWNTGLTKDEIIADKGDEISSLKEQNTELKEELKAARKLETEDFINIQEGYLLTVVDLAKKVQDTRNVDTFQE